MGNARTSDARGLWWALCLYMVAWLTLYGTALREFVVGTGLSTHNSHTVLIPIVSAFLLFQRRRSISSSVKPAPALGLCIVAVGIVTCLKWRSQGAPIDDGLSLPIFSAYAALIGGFLLVLGTRAARKALFPLAFLALAIPAPQVVVDLVVPVLQRGSAELTGLFFRSMGVTHLREGMCFHLARTSIEIAPQCSGIHSSLALLITSTLAAQLFLRRWWSRSLLLLAVLPLAMVKNAIRIVTLTLLAENVDKRFLTGHWLHESGGFVFFGITLLLFVILLLAIQRVESGRSGASSRGTAPGC